MYVCVQSLGCVWFLAAPWTAAQQASLFFTISWSCSNSCSLSQWCYLTISSSVVPVSLQSFPAFRYFLMGWLFPSGGQSISASASASVLPVNIQGWLPLGLTGLISLQSKELSRVFSDSTVQSLLLYCRAEQPSCSWTVIPVSRRLNSCSVLTQSSSSLSLALSLLTEFYKLSTPSHPSW